MKDILKNNSDKGRVWFICLLPMLGLFLQNFAVSKWAGIYLWILIVTASIICCFKDLKTITPEKASLLKNYVWLSPLYVFKRERLLGNDTYKAVISVILTAAALTMNGFVTALQVNIDSIQDIVEASPVSSLDNFSGNSDDIVGDILDNWFDDEYSCECSKSGEIYTLIYSGSRDGTKQKITFNVKHDGFAFLSFKVVSIESGGRKLEGSEYKDILAEIFILHTDNE